MMTLAAIRSRQLSLTACLFWTLVSSACGRQVDEKYLGEPLLSLRGMVTSAALTSGPGVVPALCFYHFTGDISVNGDLPPGVREEFGPGNFEEGDPNDVHIVDVEARGDFPAEFAVDVYSPPNPETLQPLVTGEVPSAFGWVCAVTADHKQVVRGLRTGSHAGMATRDSGWDGMTVRMTHDSRRYYLERFSCPANARSQTDCEISREGDATLKQEDGGHESVLGADVNVQLIYLAEPALPGSYTAYKAGAPDGLPAGYHLRAYPTEEQPGTPASCYDDPHDKIFAELNAKYGTTYEWDPDVYKAANAEHITSLQDISARVQMEVCPSEFVVYNAVDTLSIPLMITGSWPWPPLLGDPGFPPDGEQEP